MDNPIQHFKFLCWNVRGLNNQAKQEDLRQIINIFKPDLLCIQETKLDRVDPSLIRFALGSVYDNNFVALPTEGTRGGIIVAANIFLMKLSDPITTNHTILTTIHDSRCSSPW
jgi:exonuclease III